MINTFMIKLGRFMIDLGSRSTCSSPRSTSPGDLGPIQDHFEWILVGEVDLGRDVDHGGIYGSNKIDLGYKDRLGPPTPHECLGIRRGRITAGCPRCEEIRRGAPVRRWGIAYV